MKELRFRGWAGLGFIRALGLDAVSGYKVFAKTWKLEIQAADGLQYILDNTNSLFSAKEALFIETPCPQISKARVPQTVNPKPTLKSPRLPC